MSKDKRIFDLEERLIDFAVRIIRTTESLPKTRAGNHLAGQRICCGTSPAPNYGEAQSAEFRSDFMYKMKVCLKAYSDFCNKRKNRETKGHGCFILFMRVTGWHGQTLFVHA